MTTDTSTIRFVWKSALFRALVLLFISSLCSLFQTTVATSQVNSEEVLNKLRLLGAKICANSDDTYDVDISFSGTTKFPGWMGKTEDLNMLANIPLRSLYVSGFDVGMSNVEEFNFLTDCTGLTRLKLGVLRPNQNFVDNLSGLSNLVELDLFLLESKVSYSELSRLENLEKLKLVFQSVDFRDVDFIFECNSLKTVNLGIGSSKLPDRIVDQFSIQETIQELEIQGYGNYLSVEQYSNLLTNDSLTLKLTIFRDQEKS